MVYGLNMRRLRKLFSLANLTASKPRGQIATFLLLLIAVVLIFALATANMGKTVTTSTTLDNATDSATLLLGSQLATKSYQLWRSFGEKTQKCKSTGFLGGFLGMIFAAIATILSCIGGCFGLVAMMAIGAAAGAAGGAIGGTIAGTGALQGAIQGAIIGAAIGAGGYAGVGPADPGVVAGSGFPGAMVAPLTAGETIAGVAGATLAVGTSVFNAAVQQQMTADAFAAAAKALNGLPERDQVRESVFLNAFVQTVDDPNRTADPSGVGGCFWPNKWDIKGDPFDANGNSNTAETIPCFEYWFDRRVNQLKQGVPPIHDAVAAFLDGPLATFQTAAERTYTPYNCGAGSGGGGGGCTPMPPSEVCQGGQCGLVSDGCGGFINCSSWDTSGNCGDTGD